MEVLGPLDGFTVGITAHRRADEQAGLLHRLGAAVVHAPVMRIDPLQSDEPLRDATAAVLADPPDIVIATTGIGVRAWLSAAEAWGQSEELIAVLRRARTVARGPKASGALEAAGVAVTDREPTERLDALLDRLVTAGVTGSRVALQLYGAPSEWAVERLIGAGARVVAVPTYTWAPSPDPDAVERLIDAIVTARVDAVTFTSPPAVDGFVAMSETAGHGDSVRRAFETGVVAVCVGPTTAATAHQHKIANVRHPERGRLGLMVRCLADALTDTRTTLGAGDDCIVIQGATVVGPDARVALPPVERQLLAALAAAPDRVVSTTELLRAIWGASADVHALHVAMSRLRRLLAVVGLDVVTHQRRGYRLYVNGASYDAPMNGRPVLRA